MLFCFKCLLGYIRLDAFILLINFPSILIDPSVIYIKLGQNLANRGAIEINNLIHLFIFLSLGLVPKHDRGL